MTKLEFILALKDRLSELPAEEVDDRLNFLAEMIDDRIEEGLSEEDAVKDIGTIEDITEQILSETSLIKIVKNKVKPKRKMKAWEIVLISVGSPIWLSLLIALFALLISAYAVIWSVVAVAWSVFAALAGSAVGVLTGGIVLICTGKLLVGLAFIGASLVLAGLSIFAFIGCIRGTKGTAWLTGKLALAIKKLFIRKKEES